MKQKIWDRISLYVSSQRKSFLPAAKETSEVCFYRILSVE